MLFENASAADHTIIIWHVLLTTYSSIALPFIVVTVLLYCTYYILKRTIPYFQKKVLTAITENRTFIIILVVQ